jgi:hypothetical protein
MNEITWTCLKCKATGTNNDGKHEGCEGGEWQLNGIRGLPPNFGISGNPDLLWDLVPGPCQHCQPLQ